MNPKNAEIVKSTVLCLTSLMRFLDDPATHLKEFETPETMLEPAQQEKTASVGDGKVLSVYQPGAGSIHQASLKFILLNPSSQFRQITSEARSLILAGGTMQPFEEFTNLLFGPLKVEAHRLRTFTCGHVIPAEQLLVATLATGIGGKQLELSYRTRQCSETIDEFGKTLLELACAVPGGMVCFMPSYEYEQLCFSRWQRTGLVGSIETKAKRVFREPRQTNQMKAVWEEYSRTVAKKASNDRSKVGKTGGALLICVVGGKMSEGINFNDAGQIACAAR